LLKINRFVSTKQLYATWFRISMQPCNTEALRTPFFFYMTFFTLLTSMLTALCTQSDEASPGTTSPSPIPWDFVIYLTKLSICSKWGQLIILPTNAL